MSLLIIFYLINFSIVRTIVAVVTEPNNTVFRYQNMPVSYGHFEVYFYSILESRKLTSFFVEKQSECPFKCVNDLKCYSCNVAVYPVPKGLYLCEPLTADKYRAKTKFHVNASFHHYSLLVSSVVWFYLTISSVICHFYHDKVHLSSIIISLLKTMQMVKSQRGICSKFKTLIFFTVLVLCKIRKVAWVCIDYFGVLF